MAAILLFVLAGIALVVTIWDFLKKPALRNDNNEDDRSDYLKAAIDKLRGNVKPKKSFWRWLFQSERERRRDYYRNDYLKSDAWQRKRYVVLRRDNWKCVYCGGRATQVHHKKYARRNIGKEPIEWLVSVCKPCHDLQHQ
jgi:hypothetical protein